MCTFSDLFKFVNDEVKTIIEKICLNYELGGHNEVIDKYNIDILNNLNKVWRKEKKQKSFAYK